MGAAASLYSDALANGGCTMHGHALSHICPYFVLAIATSAVPSLACFS